MYIRNNYWDDKTLLLAKALPDTGAIFVCIRHPTDRISV